MTPKFTLFFILTTFITIGLNAPSDNRLRNNQKNIDSLLTLSYTQINDNILCHYSKLLERSKDISCEKTHIIRFSYFSAYAISYEVKKDYKKAIFYRNKIIDNFPNDLDKIDLFFVYIKIAENYLNLDEFEKVGKFINAAEELYNFFDELIKKKDNTDSLLIESIKYQIVNLKTLNDSKSVIRVYDTFLDKKNSLYPAKNMEVVTPYGAEIKLIKERKNTKTLTLNNELLDNKYHRQKLFFILMTTILLSFIALILFLVFYTKFQISKIKIKVLEENEKNILHNHLKQREEELIAYTVSYSKQKEQIEKIALVLSKIISKGQYDKLNGVQESIKDFVKTLSDFELIYQRLESQYPNITLILKEKHPTLSSNEIKHCLMLKLNLSLKESAQLLGVTTEAVKMARKRIKKKIKLPGKKLLREYLDDIEDIS